MVHSFKRVAVLMGGPSAEHAVSLKSGRMVLTHLDKTKYAAEGFVISRKGRWPISLGQLKRRFDIVFVAMHGEYGEDGTVQRILEKYDIPFTGSGSAPSRLGMDKGAANKIFAEAGLAVPGAGKKFPMVVKPVDRGSSVGVIIAKNQDELDRGVWKALRYSPNILIQEFIFGREFTCGVLEHSGKLTALPPTEIIPKTAEFFDYRAKYTKGASQEITPPRLPKKEVASLQRIALAAHRAIGARGFSRTDIIRDRKGKSFVLEINTIPGLTQTSLLPQQAKAAGISFSKLLEIIIEG
jgi:D-alanine-D-alanine ligase